MTAGALLMTIAGLLIAGGVVGAVAAVRGVTFLPPRTRHANKGSFTLKPKHVVALAAGIAVLLITGWPVAAIGVAAAVVFVPLVLGGGKAAQRLIDHSQALADWTRRLADLISSGAAGSTRQALDRSLTSAPEPIEGEVNKLVRRMGPIGIERALRQFAHEVHDPAAEKIAGVLILRERNGGPGLAQVLSDLAADLDERARMIREVEAERSKPRANTRFIVILTSVMMAAMMLFARTYLSSYSSIVGQCTLAGVAAIFVVALRQMRKLGDPPPAPTVLVDPMPEPSPASNQVDSR